jgi:hypothetical protein
MPIGVALPFGGYGHDKLRAQLRRRAADPNSDLPKGPPTPAITGVTVQGLFEALDRHGAKGRPLFNEWERGFIRSVHAQARYSTDFSPKQVEKLKMLLRKL